MASKDELLSSRQTKKVSVQRDAYVVYDIGFSLVFFVSF